MRATLVLILLLVPSFMLVPSATAQESGWKIEDPAGDVSVLVPLSQPTAATAATNHIDLRSITIDTEDETMVELSIKVEGLKVSPRDDPGHGFSASCGGGSWSSGGGSGSRIQFTVDFSLANSQTKYRALARILGESGGSGFTAMSGLGLLCIYGGTSGSIWQAFKVRLEPNTIRLELSKAALMGQLPSPEFPSSSSRATLPPPLKVGDQFTDFVVSSEGAVDTFICCFGPDSMVQDVAPNAGKAPVYTLRERTANSVIRLGLLHPSDALAVAPGNQSIPLLLTNQADAKRLVRLSYTVQGPDADRIKITGPAAVTTAAKERRNFSAAIDVEGSQPLDPNTRIKIRGESTGYQDEIAAVSLGLRFGAVLNEQQRMLYLHGSNAMDGFVTATGDTCNVIIFGNCRRGMLSSLETDPLASTPDDIPVRWIPGSSGFRGYVDTLASQVPNAAPFAMEGGKPTQLELKFSAAQPVDLQVKAILTYSAEDDEFVRDEIALGEGSASGSSGSPMKVSISAPNTESTIVPAGQFVRLRLDLVASMGPGVPVLAVGGMRILGKESKMELPLIAVPDALLGPALQGTFQLRAGDDGQAFVNPGEARLMNVTVLNQAADNRTAQLTLASSLAGWDTEVLPGTSFTLQPGDSIRVGVRVHAPAAATEGERAFVWLNASDEKGKPSSLRLILISTRGVDLPDDTGPYQPDEEAESKLAGPPPKESPGAGLAFALLVVGAGGVLARRRSSRDR